MAQNSLSETFETVDALLRSGEVPAARQKILELKKTPLNREERLEYARLARRAGLPELSVRLLAPLVRASGRRVVSPKPEEVADYAAALVKIGAPQEALRLLIPLDAKHLPEILLFEAFAYISVWDYRDAIPLLDEYISHPEVSTYDREIGKINLGACLVHEREARATEVLESLVDTAQKNNYKNLEGNALVLLGEDYFNRNKLALAENTLKRAEKIFSGAGSLSSLFIEKWRALLLLKKEGSTRRALESLDAVREKAAKMKHWETLRACDYFQAVILKDEALFIKNYFGTPFDAFKENLKGAFGRQVPIPDHCYWQRAGATKVKAKPIDLLKERESGKISLKERQANHRLLLILASDFYRPHRMASLHHSLYPDEFYNPLSSPVRVKKAISRLRKWMKAKSLPIEVEEDEGSYRLSPKVGFALYVPLAKNIERSLEGLVHELQEKFQDQPFSAGDASKELRMNQWTTIVLLKKAREEGLVLKVGAGNKVRYVVQHSIPSALPIQSSSVK